MAIEIVPSSAWKLDYQRPGWWGAWSNNTPRNPKNMRGLVWHDTGGNSDIDGLDNIQTLADILMIARAIDRDYTFNRGYSLGYNFMIDTLGNVIEGRGWAHSNAANAGKDGQPYDNGDTVSVLFVRRFRTDPPTAAMANAARGLDARLTAECGRQLVHLGHREVSKTDCPGDVLFALVKSGFFRGATVQPPPPVSPPTPARLLGDDMPQITPIMFHANEGQIGIYYDGRRYRVGMNGVVFMADGRRGSYRWTTIATATDDAFASGTLGGANALPGEHVDNLEAMGVLWGRLPDRCEFI